MSSPVVFILGMHRSGTSAIAGALQTLGYSFGTDLIDAKVGVNDLGFFEDKSVLALHEAVFESWGRDWRAPLLPPDGWLDTAAADGFTARVDGLISTFTRQSPWGIKDPRLCLLFPLWRDAVARTGQHSRVIISLRHPSAVADSLEARDELPSAVGHLLWLLHMLSAERTSRGVKRTIVDYDQLIQNSERHLADLVDWLDWQPADGLMTDALDFLTPSLRRHQPHLHCSDSPLVDQTWAIFADGNIDDTAAQRTLDGCYEQIVNSLGLLGPSLEGQHQRIATWEHAFAESDHQLEVVAAMLKDQQSGLANATQQLQQVHKAADGYQDAIERQKSAIIEQQSVIEAQVSALKQLAAAVDEQQSALGEQEQGFLQAVSMLKQRDQELLGAKRELEELKAELQTLRPAATSKATGLIKGTDVKPPPGESKYRGVIDLRVDNNSHTRVIRYIQQHGSADLGPILEVGCSSGYFGEALRELGFEVWGVEMHPGAVAEASTRLDQVYAGSLEAFLEDPATAGQRFQFVVFGDVIEHLVNPLATLDDCRKLLDPDGAVIVSVPNVAHKSVRLMLLEGRWNYDEVGILDRTHLHFFTRDSLNELLTEAGYRIERFSAITVGTESAGITVNPTINDVFSQFIVDNEQEVFQFVVMARPEADPQTRQQFNGQFRLRGHHRVLCLPPLKESSLFSIRLLDPLTRMREMYGGDFRISEPHIVSSEDIEWADTVVFQRESNAGLLETMRQLRQAGKRIVFDIDDLLVDVPEYLSVAEHCRAIKPYLEAALREADAISVSTNELGEALRKYNQNVYVTPNYAWTHEQPITHYASSDPVRIIVASSDTVRVDFLVESLRTVIEDPAIDVELIGIGPPGEFLRDQGLPIEVHPLMTHGHFKSFLVYRNNTIALIPLDDNRFNRCKSAIKFFDYALAGVPTVCSEVIPYTEVINNGDNGILCGDNEAEWTGAIRSLVNDPLLRQRLADTALKRCAAHHNLDRTAARWEELLVATAFPQGDPIYEGIRLHQRTPWQLLRGAIRHATRGASYRAAWNAIRNRDIRSIWSKWKATS